MTGKSRTPAETNNKADAKREIPESYWGKVWHYYKKDRFAVMGLVLVVIMFIIAFLAPIIANDEPILYKEEGKWYFPALKYYHEFRRVEWDEERDKIKSAPERFALYPPIPYDPIKKSLRERLQPPSKEHLLGTDNLGRDVLTRLIYGARVSLLVGFVAMGIALIIGIPVGAAAGYYGGITDITISRIIEIVMCFPAFFLILTILAYLPPNMWNIMIVIGLRRWVSIARYIRGEFMRIKEQDYAFAARALGARDMRIIFRHILPNSLAPVLVSAAFGVANAILIEASLSFLGFGVPPPHPTWGGILSLARSYIETAWWLALFPGIAIFLSVTSYQLVGEGLRDASDPRLYGGRGK